MKIRITVSGQGNLRDFGRLAKRLADGKWHGEAERGLIDAGRKTRTATAKAVKDQGAFRTYGAVNPHITGGRSAPLTFTIASARKGQRLEVYKGLRIAKKVDPEAGAIRSGIWNAPRRFTRSFATPVGQFRTLPGGEGMSTVAPRALWTWGRKPNQPRTATGRFAASGIRYGKIERLMGPSVSKEMVKDEALATFHREASRNTREMVEKRLAKILKY